LGNYKVDGLILKARNFGESDRIVTILDRNLGKLEAVARGARRTRSRLGGPCQPFSHNQFLLWHGRTLDGIIQCEVMHSFASLRDDLMRLAAASYMAELVDEVVRDRDPSPEVFDLLLGSYHWLGQGEATLAHVTHVLRTFELRLMTLVGFGPSLDSCATCGRPFETWDTAGRVIFSAAAGGVVCPACRAGRGPDAAGEAGTSQFSAPGESGATLVSLSPGTVKAMRYLADADFDQARVLRLTPGAAREMGGALREHITYHLDRRLRSVDFLDSVLA